MNLWAAYARARPEHAGEEPARGPFGDSPALADELLDLVVTGTKRATAGPPDPDDPVCVGGHWVVLDGAGVERLILRTTQVRTGRLDSVDDAFAHDEGEGDRSRDHWLREHRRYLRRVLRRPPDDDVDGVEMVFERFTVVWPPELADG